MFIYGFLMSDIFAQENAVSRFTPANEQADVSRSTKVVEIETDIDEEQIKKSTPVVKPTIKPRQDYKTSHVNREASSETTMRNSKLSSTSDQRPGTRHQPPGTSDQEPATSDQEPATSGQASETNHLEPTPNLITDKQFVELSETLRHLIEDNNKLKDQIAELDAQLKTARGQQKLDAKRYGEMTLERDTLRKQNEKIAGLGAENDDKLKALQKQLTEKEQNYNVQIIQLQTELAQLTKNIPPDVLVKLTNVPNPIVSPPATIVQPPAERTAESGKSKTQGEEVIAESEKRKAKSEEKSEQENLNSPSPKPLHASRDTLNALTSSARSISVDVVSSPSGQAASVEGDKILMSMDRVKNEKQQLVRDEARVHYNMGNTLFNEGDYVNAAVEYKRTIELTPEDSSAHYNLAFVSGEYLNHPRAAMEHYKKYLFYNPHAEDAEQVRQKIIEAEILVKSEMKFNSKINEEIRSKKNEVSRMLSQ